MDSLLEKALKYVESSFLIDTSIVEVMGEQLPFQLKNSASLCIARIDERDFMVLAVEDPERLAANNYLHLKRLDAKADLPLIIVTTELTAELKSISKLLRAGIIIPGRFVSMPSLMLQRESKEAGPERWVDTESSYGIIPSYLISYYLAGFFDDGFMSTEVLELLDVSKMAFSRAVKELQSHRLITEKTYGRSSHFRFSESRKSLWNHNRHRISSLSTGFIPVDKNMYNADKMFLTGESALSKYTLLGPPPRPYFGICMTDKDRYMRPITPATMKGDYFFKILNIINDEQYRHHPPGGDAMLQVFPYMPLFEKGTLSKVFLMFSRLNTSDVRVKSAISEIEDQVYTSLRD